MHYEINVSLHGRHLFATHERSMRTEDAYQRVLAHLKNKFPESEGYRISATRWDQLGTSLEVN